MFKQINLSNESGAEVSDDALSQSKQLTESLVHGSQSLISLQRDMEVASKQLDTQLDADDFDDASVSLGRLQSITEACDDSISLLRSLYPPASLTLQSLLQLFEADVAALVSTYRDRMTQCLLSVSNAQTEQSEALVENAVPHAGSITHSASIMIK